MITCSFLGVRWDIMISGIFRYIHQKIFYNMLICGILTTEMVPKRKEVQQMLSLWVNKLLTISTLIIIFSVNI